MPTKLGIVAGSGLLPAGIAEACRKSGREFFIVALEGHADPKTVAGLPHAWVRLGAGGKAIDLLHREGVTDVVLAGAVRRPSLAELKPDFRTAKFAAKGFFNRGDDGLLSAVVNLLEVEEGFKVVAAQDLLDGVLASRGELGKLSPTDRDKQDIERGIGVLDALASADVGQAVAVQDGVVLGVEAAEGTDRLILRSGELSREGRGPILVKLPKTGQEQRVDLPTLGPTTVANLAQAGFVGAAFAAGETLMVEVEATVAAADAAGLFLLGLDRAAR